MSRNRAACTIIAKNYFAAAKTLAQSFLSRHPGDKFYVLVVDDFAEYLNPADEPFEILQLADLNIPDLPTFCFKYNIVELCTAVKARFLEHLIIEKEVEKLLYIDPDILVTNSLEGLFQSLDEHDIVLTPHIDVDYPEDEYMPNEGVILTHGVFNLGFIGVNASDNAREFLRWWHSKLRDKCFIDLETGYYVDQRFIDLVPVLFENYHIERNSGYNVGWWNIHSRSISREGDTWLCNGAPLYFFHFSSYRPEKPDVLSRNTTRHTMLTRPDLQLIFAEYRELLMRNGYEQSSQWPYTYDFFDSGKRIPPKFRPAYRQSLRALQHYGNPFESAGLRRALAFLSRMSEGEPFAGLLLFAYRFGSPLIRLYRRLLKFGRAWLSWIQTTRGSTS